MAITISRASGDETPVKVLWKGDVDFRDVTAITLNVYNNAKKETLLEALTGEMQGFDPATYFPVLTPGWTGTRYWQLVITRGAEDQPLPELHTWVQE